MDQNQRIEALRQLARSGDLRVAATERNCFYYVSDQGKARLGEMLEAASAVVKPPEGVSVESPRVLPALANQFDVGTTPHFINYETLKFLCGNVPVSDVLRGNVGMMPRTQRGAELY